MVLSLVKKTLHPESHITVAVGFSTCASLQGRRSDAQVLGFLSHIGEGLVLSFWLQSGSAPTAASIEAVNQWINWHALSPNFKQSDIK